MSRLRLREWVPDIQYLVSILHIQNSLKWNRFASLLFLSAKEFLFCYRVPFLLGFIAQRTTACIARRQVLRMQTWILTRSFALNAAVELRFSFNK